MNYAEIKYCDIANGTGVRTSLFVSGCRFHCPGCFNAVAWDFLAGEPFTQEVEDRIIGLELGADDYLIKPFSPRELVARVRALLRRVHADSEPQREVLEFGDLTIDVSGHKVLVSGKEVDLTASEFKLLTTLSRYPGRVYSRMELVEKVLGYDFEGYERTIDSHVKNLRAKIGDNPRNPKWLHTVHGVGYRFEDPTKTGVAQ
jgi:DNA-binding response OmpR family regulator